MCELYLILLVVRHSSGCVEVNGDVVVRTSFKNVIDFTVSQDTRLPEESIHDFARDLVQALQYVLKICHT